MSGLVDAGDAGTAAPAANHSSDAIYDRQIRLWGASAQEKIMNTRVLFLHPTPLLSEICKNLVLAGLSGTLMTDRKLTRRDVQPMLFVSPAMVGENVAQSMLPNVRELNPLATIEADERPFEQVTQDDLKAFNIILADPTHLTEPEINRLNKASRANGSKLFLASSFGYESCAFLDLGETHECRKEIAKGELGDVVRENFCTFEECTGVKLEGLKTRFWKSVDKR